MKEILKNKEKKQKRSVLGHLNDIPLYIFRINALFSISLEYFNQLLIQNKCVIFCELGVF